MARGTPRRRAAHRGAAALGRPPSAPPRLCLSTPETPGSLLARASYAHVMNEASKTDLVS